jgi:hypothetical protein
MRHAAERKRQRGSDRIIETEEGRQRVEGRDRE